MLPNFLHSLGWDHLATNDDVAIYSDFSLRRSVAVSTEKHNSDDDFRNKMSVIFLRKPQQNVPDFAQRTLFEVHMRPYILRAFNEDPDTISDEAAQEHYDHAIPGDGLFLAVISNDIHHFRVVGHVLVTCRQIKDKESFLLFEQGMYCNAICCDPLVQHAGVSTNLVKAAVETFRPQAVVLRTMNPSVVKLLKRMAQEQRNKTTDNSCDAVLYPEECSDDDSWARAGRLGDAVVNSWDHLRADVSLYDSQRLAFRSIYRPERISVFGGVEERDDDPRRKIAPGDAVLCILLL
eukprot:PhM_4_TR10418/c0_g1_i3/m.22307